MSQLMKRQLEHQSSAPHNISTWETGQSLYTFLYSTIIEEIYGHMCKKTKENNTSSLIETNFAKTQKKKFKSGNTPLKVAIIF